MSKGGLDLDLSSSFDEIYDIKDELKIFNMFAGGKWRASEKNEAFDIRTPIDGSVIARAQRATPEDVNQAASAAKEMRGIRELPAIERIEIFNCAAGILDQPRVVQPALGARADSQAEAVPDGRVSVKMPSLTPRDAPGQACMLHGKESSWSGTAPFRIWLARIATNEALMRIRRSRRLQAAALQLSVHDGGPRPDPEQEAATREEMARVAAALPRLPAHHREILQLASISDLSRADVARRLGVSEEAVKVRLHRARAALRGMLGEPAPGRPRTPPLVLASVRRTLIGCGQHRRRLLD